MARVRPAPRPQPITPPSWINYAPPPRAPRHSRPSRSGRRAETPLRRGRARGATDPANSRRRLEEAGPPSPSPLPSSCNYTDLPAAILITLRHTRHTMLHALPLPPPLPATPSRPASSLHLIRPQNQPSEITRLTTLPRRPRARPPARRHTAQGRPPPAPH